MKTLPVPVFRLLRRWVVGSAWMFGLAGPALNAAQADLILHRAKVVTVDPAFSIQQAVAIKDGRIFKIGTDEAVLADKGPNTELIDLAGRMVLPGLMDSHAHPADACLTELDHPIPPMERIQDVLDYIQSRARALKEGEWIEVRQVFITRLREQRYPTRVELDRAAPKHPVIFATGPDASLNSLALKLSGIDREFKVADGGTGFAEKDSATGEPTGILRNCSRYVKLQSAKRPVSRVDKVRRLKELFADYNSVGITSVCDRDASLDEIETYKELHRSGGLTVRANLRNAGSAATDWKHARAERCIVHRLGKRCDIQISIKVCRVFNYQVRHGQTTSSATTLRKVPIAGQLTSTTSAGTSHFGGSKRPPAPGGVPVAMMSPGSSVVNVEM